MPGSGAVAGLQSTTRTPITPEAKDEHAENDDAQNGRTSHRCRTEPVAVRFARPSRIPPARSVGGWRRRCAGLRCLWFQHDAGVERSRAGRPVGSKLGRSRSGCEPLSRCAHCIGVGRGHPGRLRTCRGRPGRTGPVGRGGRESVGAQGRVYAPGRSAERLWGMSPARFQIRRHHRSRSERPRRPTSCSRRLTVSGGKVFQT